MTSKKLPPKQMAVPQPVKRTSGVAPNFLWDKTAYVLGVTAGEGKRLAEEHAAFVERHLKELDGSEDAGLKALRLFLQSWNPENFTPPLWPEEMRDQNVVFELAADHRKRFLHERPAARALWERLNAEGASGLAVCLVTGEAAPVARLHPAVKGVWGLSLPVPRLSLSIWMPSPPMAMSRATMRPFPQQSQRVTPVR